MQGQESRQIDSLKAESSKERNKSRGDDQVVRLPACCRSFSAAAMRYGPDISRMILWLRVSFRMHRCLMTCMKLYFMLLWELYGADLGWMISATISTSSDYCLGADTDDVCAVVQHWVAVEGALGMGHAGEGTGEVTQKQECPLQGHSHGNVFSLDFDSSRDYLCNFVILVVWKFLRDWEDG